DPETAAPGTTAEQPVEPTPAEPLVPPAVDPTDVPAEPEPPAPPPAGTGDLQTINPNGAPIQEGSSGERVRRLQVALQVFGYNPGPPDGAYGPATRDAISAFQTENNLDSDGVAGRATLRAINQRIRTTA
ncbi:MAG: peptidoglycan-binding domain-containing protein, partial [Gaiellaceae bacterium]